MIYGYKIKNNKVITESTIISTEMVPIFESSEINGYLLELNDLMSYMVKNEIPYKNAIVNIAEANQISKNEINIIIDDLLLSEEENNFVDYLYSINENVVSRDLEIQISEALGLEILYEASEAKLKTKKAKLEGQLATVQEKIKWWNKLSPAEKNSETNKALISKFVLGFLLGISGIVAHNVYLKISKNPTAFKDYNTVLKKAESALKLKIETIDKQLKASK